MKADRTLPPGALMGAGVLVGSALSLVILARLTGYRPAEAPASSVVVAQELRFEDRTDGGIAIFTGGENRLVENLAPGTNGFVRGVLRGLMRERKAESIGPAEPFRLTRWANGRLSLDDPSTGRHVDLEVFGPTNAGAFAQILTASQQSKEKS